MTNTIKLSLVGLLLLLTISSKAFHNDPIMKIDVTKVTANELSIDIKIAKLYLVGQKLTNKDFSASPVRLKQFLAEHIKLYANGKSQPLRLQSITENISEAKLTYKVIVTKPLQDVKIFSDCLDDMEAHDRIPIRIKAGFNSKQYAMNQRKATIVLEFEE